MGTATTSKIPLILLFGPTAVGKTDLVLELFRGRGEIVNVDSVQVYRKLDIGSAKPDSSFLEELPHHLIDIRDISEKFNAADFIRLADEAIVDIHNRGLIPVLAGGTAFYFKNFCLGLKEGPPPSDPAVRGELEGLAVAGGLGELWEELKHVDPSYAAKIHPNDQLRIVRAMEVFRISGRPLSSFEQGEVFRDCYDYCLIGLTRDREELYRRIDLRVDIMMKEGLVDEIKGLLAAGATEDDPGLNAIGYKEFFEMGRRGCMTMADTADRIRRNSRRYAKRQMTFFQSLPGVSWFHPEKKEEISSHIENFLSKQ
ncbi:MAG: tRNA (adenosine(37)-N6)-dimethylallyltransferase MiaA [Spirochaetales bacterium]|nr:tRNA (adenosine(37)-N6)-dimethylallyltransferase MiaA [Spirochaetales bacterium]